jgi:hypothetical protein
VSALPGSHAPAVGVVPVDFGLVIEVLDANGAARMVRLESSGERVTDLVNRGQTLAVRPALRLETGVDSPPEALDLDQVLILVPPPQPTDQRHRLHRPGRPVRIVVGPYEVIGDAHVPPGTQAVGFLTRNWPRFVPLTDASLRLTTYDGYRRRVPVAIVNLAMAELLREVGAQDALPE